MQAKSPDAGSLTSFGLQVGPGAAALQAPVRSVSASVFSDSSSPDFARARWHSVDASPAVLPTQFPILPPPLDPITGSPPLSPPMAKSALAQYGKPLLIVYVTMLLGIGLYVNGIATSHAGLSVTEGTLLLALGRVAGAWVIASIFAAVPALDAPAQESQPPAPLLGCITVPVIVWPALTGIGQVVMNWTFIYANQMGNVGLFGPLVGLHSAVTMTYGLVVEGQARTPLRLAGIALSALSVVLLGCAQNGESSSSGKQSLLNGTIVPILLGLALIFGFGLLDVLSVEGGRRLRRAYVALSFGAGQLVAALVCALLLVFGEAGRDLPLEMSEYSWIMLGMNFVGVTSWLGFVVLGQIASINEYVPFVSMYGIIPAIIGYAFLHMPVMAPQIAGICLAAVAVVAVSIAPVTPQQQHPLSELKTPLASIPQGEPAKDPVDASVCGCCPRSSRQGRFAAWCLEHDVRMPCSSGA